MAKASALKTKLGELLDFKEGKAPPQSSFLKPGVGRMIETCNITYLHKPMCGHGARHMVFDVAPVVLIVVASKELHASLSKNQITN